MEVNAEANGHQAAQQKAEALSELKHLPGARPAHEAADVFNVAVALTPSKRRAQKVENVPVSLRHGNTKRFSAWLGPSDAATLAWVYGD